MINFPEVFDSLVKGLGLMGEEVENFLHPDYTKLHDPLLLPNMERARDRVIEGIKNNEHIVIFSDYDADGIPGAAVLSDFFRLAKYENVSFYIPHRHDEGFGLNKEAIDEIKEREAKLIITVDCGIADAEEVKHAKKRGIDVIITDHHLPTGHLPEAYAIVNPKLPDLPAGGQGSKYPFSELCGAALAYKLVQAILQKENFGVKEGMEKWSLDLVGIATLSDMVPLVGENRIFAKYGLDVLRKTKRPGLIALMRKLNMSREYLTEDDVTFMITPRINAASRMGVPMDAFKLLTAESEAEAQTTVDHLEKINNERKGAVASLVKDAKKHLKDRETIKEVIVIGNPEWRPALLGLVANSLVEEYLRPVFVWGRDGDGMLKGSCRSYNGCDLHSLMHNVKDFFLEFGGHEGAGGFSTDLEKLVSLEEKLSEAYRNLASIPEKEKKENIKISVKEVGEKLWDTVSLFAPFGMGNPKPIFAISGKVKDVRQFGKENNHLELVIADGRNEIKAISFFSAPSSFSLLPMPGLSCSVHAHLENSYFRNRSEIRLRIVDILA